MAQVIKTTFQLRRGLLEVWEKNNPVLAKGEPSFILDKNALKIGDGVTPWKELDYIGLNQEDLTKAIEDYFEKNPEAGGTGKDGRGIISITRTEGNGTPGTVDIYTILYSDSTTSTFSVYNGQDGEDGYTPVKGTDYFTEADKQEIAEQAASMVEIPDSAGYVVQDTAPTDTSVLWVDMSDDSNDGFQDAINLALAQAKASGKFDGKDGEQGPKGDPGEAGADGYNVLYYPYITFATDGESTFQNDKLTTTPKVGDLVIDQGGAMHKVTAVAETTCTVVNICSLNGKNGYTPARGTDYWTDADKAEIVADVMEQIPSGGSAYRVLIDEAIETGVTYINLFELPADANVIFLNVGFGLGGDVKFRVSDTETIDWGNGANLGNQGSRQGCFVILYRRANGWKLCAYQAGNTQFAPFNLPDKKYLALSYSVATTAITTVFGGVLS